MQAALRETVLLGLTTNWQFLQDVLAHPDFAAGQVYTTWVEDILTAGSPRSASCRPKCWSPRP